METPFANPAEAVLILNQLSESTKGYYFYYSFENHHFYLSKNFETADDFFTISKTVCTLAEWNQAVNPHDMDRLVQTMEDLVSRKIQHFSINYRVLNSKGNSSWVNSCGSLHYGENGQVSYVLGEMTFSAPVHPSSSYTSHALIREAKHLLELLKPGFLLLIGVDNLKTINMKRGRRFGDAVLSDVEQILQDESNQRYTVYHISGDWFALNMPGAEARDAASFFERVQERVSGQCTISGGCVSYTDFHVADEHILLQYAESALDRSKSCGKNRLTFFTPEIYQKKLQELELWEDLQASVSSGFAGFEVYFQPQFRAEKFTLYGAEALLRYHSPRRGSVPPSEIVPILERSGLICPVGLWVLREALRQCRQWRAVFPQFHISVNMSYHQLEQASIEEDLLDLVSSSGVPGDALTIEVTESMQLSDYPHLNQLFRRWRKYGIEISADDFGTGYSSLSRLKEMAVDEIKIDRCFVTGIQNSAYNYRLLNNILELAGSNQVRTCCEGVETIEELKVLNGLHCSLMQGYLFSPPCPAGEFERWFIAAGPDALPSSLHLSSLQDTSPELPAPVLENTVAQTILDAENDFFYLCDLETYQLYYMNPAGQKLFGIHDYQGKTCYKVLHGRDTPCPFCNNSQLYQNSFSIWEQENPYCQRHFLLKDRIVTYRGRKARLEVGTDITKREYVSQAAQERLDFAEKIVDYMNTLADYPDYNEAVNRVLASVGDFYQADRAYLFEPSATQPGCWTNTFEWCAVNVSPQKDHLQAISQEQLSRWMDLFSQDQSVILFSLDPLRTAHPSEWETLHAQGIQRLIAVPLRSSHKTVGFIGVDNPRYCIHDDSQVRVLAGFLLARMAQDQNRRRCRILIQESNQDLLHSLHVGFWTLNIHKNSGAREMVMDSTMQEILGLPDFFSPEEIYHFWHSRVPAEAQPAVDASIRQMVETGKLVQLECPWHHDKDGPIALHLSGLLIDETSSLIRLNGYCRRMNPQSPRS